MTAALGHLVSSNVLWPRSSASLHNFRNFCSFFFGIEHPAPVWRNRTKLILEYSQTKGNKLFRRMMSFQVWERVQNELWLVDWSWFGIVIGPNILKFRRDFLSSNILLQKSEYESISILQETENGLVWKNQVKVTLTTKRKSKLSSRSGSNHFL